MAAIRMRKTARSKALTMTAVLGVTRIMLPAPSVNNRRAGEAGTVPGNVEKREKETEWILRS